MNKKIALIGSGNIGGTLAMLLLQKAYQEIVLFDMKAGIAKGKALDLAQAGALMHSPTSIWGADDYNALEGSDIVVVTAGSPRLPGMSRDDLLQVNAKVMVEVGAAIKKHCPDAITICITNPLDAMVSVLQKAIGSDYKKTMGMAGVLDSARMTFFLSQHFQTSSHNINSIVMGGHGDTMVPVSNHCRVFDRSLDDLVASGQLSHVDLEFLIDRTRKGGGEIVQLLQTGSAYYAPAYSALTMVEAIAQDQKRLLPVAAYVTKEYAVEKPIYLGVPAIIGAAGVESIISYDLTEDQQKLLDHSAKSVNILNEDLKRLGFL